MSEPLFTSNLVGINKMATLQLWDDAYVVLDGSHGSVMRDVCIRNMVPNTVKDVVLRGATIRVDNLRLMGCRLLLDGLQNSNLIGITVVRSLGNAIEIINDTANCLIQAVIRYHDGYGIVIDSPGIRSIHIHTSPVEDCKLGSVLVKSCSKFGNIVLNGRLNVSEGHGPPLTVAKECRPSIIWQRPELDIRNQSGKPDYVET